LWPPSPLLTASLSALWTVTSPGFPACAGRTRFLEIVPAAEMAETVESALAERISLRSLRLCVEELSPWRGCGVSGIGIWVLPKIDRHSCWMCLCLCFLRLRRSWVSVAKSLYPGGHRFDK